MTLAELQALLTSGEFHHATYRNFGTVWEGLWIYRKAKALLGFEVAGCFSAYLKNPELDAAYELVRKTGVSVGAYGKG